VHITILTVGSRGDVQPYLALAGGLSRAGYQVRVATHRPFQAEIHQRGLEFRPVAGNPRQLLESEAGLAWLEAGRNPLAGTRRLIQLARPRVARLLADAAAACQDTQAIIYAPLGMAGYHLAEAQQVPAILAALVPLTPTRAVMGYRVRRWRPVGWLAISSARCSSRWGSPPTPCSASKRPSASSPTAAWNPAPVVSITTVAAPSTTSATVTR
jgi:UDP:flavonoid glycosyltransferase YjiC (YdhE family)